MQVWMAAEVLVEFRLHNWCIWVLQGDLELQGLAVLNISTSY